MLVIRPGGIGDAVLFFPMLEALRLAWPDATLDVLSHGAAPFGALVAAAIAEAYGVRAAIWVAWVGMSASVLFVLFSPLPRLRSVADIAQADRPL